MKESAIIFVAKAAMVSKYRRKRNNPSNSLSKDEISVETADSYVRCNRGAGFLG